MTTQINVTIGDQRLLQNSKTRAAANQQALDDRQQNAKTETKASTALEQTAERRNGVPENVVDRRPAAQRRKGLSEIGFVGGKLLRSRSLPETEITRSVPWTDTDLTGSFLDFSVFPPVLRPTYTLSQKTNVYTYNTTVLAPLFDNVQKITPSKPGTKNNLKNIFISGFPSYEVPFNFTSLDWTQRKKTIFAGSVSVVTDVIAPAFDLPINNIRQTQTRKVITSCTPTHVYYSVLLRVYKTSQFFASTFNDSNVFNAYRRSNSSISSNPSFILTTPFLISSKTGTITDNRYGSVAPGVKTVDYALDGYDFDEIAFYSVYSLESKQLTTNAINISDRLRADPDLNGYADKFRSEADYPFLLNLNSNDPHSSLFKTFLDSYSGSSSLFIKKQAAFYSANAWPSSLNYDPKNRSVYMFADPPAGYTGSDRDVMRYFIPLGEETPSYNTLLGIFGGATVFRRDFLESRGFEYVDTFDISSGNTLYDVTFPVVRTRGNYEHSPA